MARALMMGGRAGTGEMRAVTQGFSLIELLVTLAIVAILFSLVLPSYQFYTKKSRLAEGRAALLALQGEMERYLFDESVYPENLSQLPAYDEDRVESRHGYFEISIEASLASCSAGTCYVLLAEPILPERADERLELYSDGRKLGAWRP